MKCMPKYTLYFLCTALHNNSINCYKKLKFFKMFVQLNFDFKGFQPICLM